MPNLENRYIIIGGTSKAATTSVFNYLSNHPRICPAIAKETRFFLDGDYPLSSRHRVGNLDEGAYERWFKCNNRNLLRLEATPDYLYSKGTPDAIERTLSHFEMVFILREPVSRFISWYRFARARGIISRSLSLSQFISAQSNREPFQTDVTHPAFLALVHGRYTFYLRRYVEKIGRARAHVLFQEELRQEPVEFMRRLCEALGLEYEGFADFVFTQMNRSVDVRSAKVHRGFGIAKKGLRSLSGRAPRLREALRRARPIAEGIYRRFNVLSESRTQADSESIKFLTDYYMTESEELAMELGCRVPW